MAARVWYPQTRQEQAARAESLIKVWPVPKMAIYKRSNKKMTPTNSTERKTKIVTKEVFDLNTFDNITIGAEVDLPKKPETLEEALRLYDNNPQKILDLVYKGMIDDASNVESQDLIWRTFAATEEDEEPKLTQTLYEGPAADESKKKVIDAMVLSYAKAAFGFKQERGSGDANKEANKKAKDAAKAMIRSNEAMLASLKNS